MKNNPNNQYLITLTPAGNYFFGNDRGFGDKSYNPDAINYLVSGLKYPQQTTLLGFLRYELLRNAGCLAPKHTTDEAKTLIGKSGGFDGSDKKYGIIKSLSPVFLKLQKGNETTFILPSGKVFQDGTEKYVDEFDDVVEGNSVVLTEYDPKKYLTDLSEFVIINKTGKETVFGEAQQIGIKKNYQGNTEDEAFFKQTFSRLKKNHKKQRYAFAFYVEFTRKLNDNELKSDMVFMGGDQSIFKLEIKKLENEPIMENLFEKIDAQNNEFIDQAIDSNKYKVVLLSDCKLNKTIFDNSIIGINEVVDFRHITTRATTSRFGHVGKNATDLDKSDKQELITKGSVFYVRGSQLKEFCNEFENHTEYKTIGYNNFQISK